MRLSSAPCGASVNTRSVTSDRKILMMRWWHNTGTHEVTRYGPFDFFWCFKVPILVILHRHINKSIIWDMTDGIFRWGASAFAAKNYLYNCPTFKPCNSMSSSSSVIFSTENLSPALRFTGIIPSLVFKYWPDILVRTKCSFRWRINIF